MDGPRQGTPHTPKGGPREVGPEQFEHLAQLLESRLQGVGGLPVLVVAGLLPKLDDFNAVLGRCRVEALDGGPGDAVSPRCPQLFEVPDHWAEPASLPPCSRLNLNEERELGELGQLALHVLQQAQNLAEALHSCGLMERAQRPERLQTAPHSVREVLEGGAEHLLHEGLAVPRAQERHAAPREALEEEYSVQRALRGERLSRGEGEPQHIVLAPLAHTRQSATSAPAGPCVPRCHEPVQPPSRLAAFGTEPRFSSRPVGTGRQTAAVAPRGDGRGGLGPEGAFDINA